MAWHTERQHTKSRLKHHTLGISDQQMINIYVKMVLVRRLDERLWTLNRMGSVPLIASCQGAEATSMGIAWAGITDGNCFFFPYYRDLPLKLMAGVTLAEAMSSHFGKAADPMSGGRQFLLQGASIPHRIIHTSNVVGSNLCQATGYSLGSKIIGDNMVTLVSFGDGGSSQGECHEAMNFASVHQLPIVFLCHNNKLAISVPQHKQMAIENVATRASAYNIPGHIVDGTDIIDVYEKTSEAIRRARATSGGPTLLEFKVERFRPHTSDDDQTRYRTTKDLEAAYKRDPLAKLHDYLEESNLLSNDEDREIQSRCYKEIDAAIESMSTAPPPDVNTLLNNVYSD